GQKQIGAHPLVPVSGVEGHFLLSPEIRVLFDRVKGSIEGRRVVPIQILKHGENLVGHWFFFCEIPNRNRNSLRRSAGNGRPLGVLNASEAVSRSAIKRRLCVRTAEHIAWFVPGAA